MNQMNPGFFARQQHATVAAKIMSQFRAYLRADGADIVRCCTWLGGPVWGLRAAELVVALRQAARPSRKQLKELHALHRLLRLDLVDDFENPEASRFAELNLHDSRVERCCRHCDTIGDFIATLAAAAAEAPAAAA